MPSTSDNVAVEPAILAEDVWVNFLIRYHRSEVTLRETVVRMFDRGGRNGSKNGRWSQEFSAHDRLAYLQFYYMLNPVACLFESYRDAMIGARMPEPGMVLYLAAVSVAMFVVGFVFFTRGEGKFAKYV